MYCMYVSYFHRTPLPQSSLCYQTSYLIICMAFHPHCQHGRHGASRCQSGFLLTYITSGGLPQSQALMEYDAFCRPSVRHLFVIIGGPIGVGAGLLGRLCYFICHGGCRAHRVLEHSNFCRILIGRASSKITQKTIKQTKRIVLKMRNRLCQWLRTRYLMRIFGPTPLRPAAFRDDRRSSPSTESDTHSSNSSIGTRPTSSNQLRHCHHRLPCFGYFVIFQLNLSERPVLQDVERLIDKATGGRHSTNRNPSLKSNNAGFLRSGWPSRPGGAPSSEYCTCGGVERRGRVVGGACQ